METPNTEFWGMNEKSFITLMHLSQFAGFIIPFAGLALPIIMWVMNKDKSEKIDEHGKNILNWIISASIYAIVSSILILILVGIFLLIGIGILAIVFPILAVMKWNKDETWKYPLTITFIK